MPVYQYQAINEQGHQIQGTYIADSKAKVLEILKTKNSYPLSIHEVQSTDIRSLKTLSKVRTKDIALLCRQLYTLLNSGATIVNALEILQLQTQNKKLKKALVDVYKDVQKGHTFSEGIKKNTDDVFPKLFVYMVEAGEISGNLDEIMLRLANHYEKEFKITNKIKSAMIYPAILLVISLLVVAFLLVFVMPMFLSMLSQGSVALPVPTRILLSISNLLTDYWLVLTAVLIIALYGSKIYFKSQSGEIFLDKMKLTIPVIKNLNQKIITTRFTRTLAILLSSGIPMLEALENVAKVVDNKVVAKELLSIKEVVRKGTNLAEPVKRSGLFPPLVDNMIKIGEETGNLEYILDKTADIYDEEVDNALQETVALIEPLMIVFMSLLIGFVVIAILMPMFNLVQTV